MMAIGERIRFFRNLRGMTQKYLGCLVGFPEKTADIRMAQYESGTRSPKADLTNKLAEVFGISPDALNVPDIDSYIGLMHTLFTLEDIYGLTIEKRDGEIIMRVDPFNSREARNLLDELIHSTAEKHEIFWTSFTFGVPNVKNTAMAKSARTTTISGVITIQSIPMSIMRKLPHRN